MRALSLSLILAFTLILSGGSMAGSSDAGAPNAGLFAYGGAVVHAPVVMLASR